ncbi:MAG: potassium-transporting ATPase subunit KdpC [Methylococcaceae bacterium]|nr:potassium-transporting ATPase subunit KdpC [Methylococcaceae bacterium]
MISYLKPALILLTLLTLLTGVAYPLLVTGLAQLIFPEQANGSLLKDDSGKVIGSKMIGQTFSNPAYFWGRPSATAPYPYNAGASGGSNLGPTNPALLDAVKTRIAALHAADPENKAPIPVDLITASASGLDPHISPAAAEYQVDRIARLKHIAPEKLREWVELHTEERQWEFLGEKRVNVLSLNMALTAIH